MNTIGVVLLVAATATGQFGKPHVGLKRFLRHHVEAGGAPPPGGMISPASMGGDAGGGLGGGGAQPGRRFPNVRSQVYFVDPPGMHIGWQTAAAGSADRVYLPAQLTVPARYNFTQGYIYRLKLTDIPGRPGLALYPTLEVAPSTPATDAYLTHNPIPAIFTEEDFDQVQAGNFVTKVIYLPDPKYQELAISGVETLVSTKLEPGVDPILEADKRGTILMIVRLGAIDLEMNQSGIAAGGYVPGATAPNLMPGSAAPATIPNVPVDETAPVTPETPAPTTPPQPGAPAPAAEPGAEPAKPAAEPAKPADEPAKPADEPAKPADAPKAASNVPPLIGEPPINAPGTGF